MFVVFKYVKSGAASYSPTSLFLLYIRRLFFNSNYAKKIPFLVLFFTESCFCAWIRLQFFVLFFRFLVLFSHLAYNFQYCFRPTKYSLSYFLQFFVLFLKTAPNHPRIRLRTKNCFYNFSYFLCIRQTIFRTIFPIFSTVFLCQKYNLSYYFQYSRVRSTISGIRTQPIPVSRSADPGPILYSCIRQDTHLSDICPLRVHSLPNALPCGRSC